jgi:hypothetical protein
MMAAAEQRLRALGCPKIQVQIRHDNARAIGFYRRLGYSEDAVVSMGKRLVKDDSTWPFGAPRVSAPHRHEPDSRGRGPLHRPDTTSLERYDDLARSRRAWPQEGRLSP